MNGTTHYFTCLDTAKQQNGEEMQEEFCLLHSCHQINEKDEDYNASSRKSSKG